MGLGWSAAAVGWVCYLIGGLHVTIELPMDLSEQAQYLASEHNLWVPSSNSLYVDKNIKSLAWSASWLECC
jgi:hypothetical protein